MSSKLLSVPRDETPNVLAFRTGGLHQRSCWLVFLLTVDSTMLRIMMRSSVTVSSTTSSACMRGSATRAVPNAQFFARQPFLTTAFPRAKVPPPMYKRLARQTQICRSLFSSPTETNPSVEQYDKLAGVELTLVSTQRPVKVTSLWSEKDRAVLVWGRSMG